MQGNFPIEVCDPKYCDRTVYRKYFEYLNECHKDEWEGSFCRFATDKRLIDRSLYYDRAGAYLSDGEADMMHVNGHYVRMRGEK